VKLDTVNRQFFVLDTHHDVFKDGCLFQAVREGGRTQTMVAAGMEGIFQTLKYTFPRVGDSRGLSVHHAGGVADDPSKILDNGLMT